MKLTDWHDRLIALIEQRKRAPFEWGVNDCCLWAADAVLAQTGRDPAQDLRGTYTTARGARAALRLAGGLEGAGDRCGQPVERLFAQTGDVGIVSRTGERMCAGVCTGGMWLTLSERGIAPIAFDAVVRAWRVA